MRREADEIRSLIERTRSAAIADCRARLVGPRAANSGSRRPVGAAAVLAARCAGSRRSARSSRPRRSRCCGCTIAERSSRDESTTPDRSRSSRHRCRPRRHRLPSRTARPRRRVHRRPGHRHQQRRSRGADGRQRRHPTTRRGRGRFRAVARRRLQLDRSARRQGDGARGALARSEEGGDARSVVLVRCRCSLRRRSRKHRARRRRSASTQQPATAAAPPVSRDIARRSRNRSATGATFELTDAARSRPARRRAACSPCSRATTSNSIARSTTRAELQRKLNAADQIRDPKVLAEADRRRGREPARVLGYRGSPSRRAPHDPDAATDGAV